MEKIDVEKKYKPWVILLSVLIPGAVAALFFVKIDGVDLSFLPHFYSVINALTAIVLIMALMAVKSQFYSFHQRMMQVAIVLSVVFLLSYVLYHMTSETTIYGDVDGDGKLSDEEALDVAGSRMAYFIILLSHIVLSIAVIPLVLFTYLKAWAEKFDQHKRLARITFPIWLYVAITGVVVYIMISPYYQ